MIFSPAVLPQGKNQASVESVKSVPKGLLKAKLILRDEV
jgi:hypothetical protein